MTDSHPTRIAPRHALVLNLRFEREGTLHRGVSANVSATGMYIRTTHAPSAGEIITMTRIPGDGEVRAELVSEVRWGQATPTMDAPEPGFGVRFMEIYAAKRDRDALIALLSALGVADAGKRVRITTRDGITLASCHFDP